MPGIDLADIFKEFMFAFVREMGNLMLSILSQAWPVIIIFIAVPVGIRLIKMLVGAGMESYIPGDALTAEVDDGIPDTPDGWYGSDEEWRERWVKRQNDDLFWRKYREEF